MAQSTDTAVALASQVTDVGFAEFTAKLVTDVFSALIDANVRQMQSYQQLVEVVSQSLAEFLSQSASSVAESDVDTFLVAHPWVFARRAPTTGELDVLNAALKLPAIAGVQADNTVTIALANNQLTTATVDAIRLAVRRKLTAMRYDLLQEMVRTGMLRLVMDNGIIESRLTFTTWGSHEHTDTSTQEARGGGVAAGAVGLGGLGGLLRLDLTALVGGAAGGVAGFAGGALTTTTASTMHRDVEGSQVDIFGRVLLRLKTDYVPLQS